MDRGRACQKSVGETLLETFCRPLLIQNNSEQHTSRNEFAWSEIEGWISLCPNDYYSGIPGHPSGDQGSWSFLAVVCKTKFVSDGHPIGCWSSKVILPISFAWPKHLRPIFHILVDSKTRTYHRRVAAGGRGRRRRHCGIFIRRGFRPENPRKRTKNHTVQIFVIYNNQLNATTGVVCIV